MADERPVQKKPLSQDGDVEDVTAATAATDTHSRRPAIKPAAVTDRLRRTEPEKPETIEESRKDLKEPSKNRQKERDRES